MGGGGKEHPQGLAAALPALGGCGRWALLPLAEHRGDCPCAGSCRVGSGRAGGAGAKSKAPAGPWESCKGSSVNWWHPRPLPSRCCSFESYCLQRGTSTGNIFLRCCLSIFFLYIALCQDHLSLVPQVSVGCSLNPLLVYLLSVVVLCLCSMLLCSVHSSSSLDLLLLRL